MIKFTRQVLAQKFRQISSYKTLKSTIMKLKFSKTDYDFANKQKWLKTAFFLTNSLCMNILVLNICILTCNI